MVRYALTLFLLFHSPAYAQDQSAIVDKLFPHGVSKVDFFGDTLATIAFCNLWNHVDQYDEIPNCLLVAQAGIAQFNS